MAITGAAGELDTTKQSLIASLVQKELAFNAKLIPLINDFSAMAVPGAKQISFPKLTSFTVANRAEGVAGVPTALTSSVDTLLLDKNAYVSWIIDAYTKAQSNINAEMEFAKRAAAAQARYVDEQIISTIRSVASSFENPGADVDVTYASLRAMLLKLETADADPSKMSWIVSPAQKSVIMSLAEFKDASAFGGQAVVPSGMIGTILGSPVYYHNGLAAKELFLIEKDGLAIGFQKNASYGEESDIDYGVGAMKVAVDQIFGTTGLELGVKGAAAGKSPLVVGLND